MLTGSEIKKRVESGEIYIEDFDEKRLNPNSYNLRLGSEMKIYNLRDGECLDMRYPALTIDIHIPETGYILEPGILYLATTKEYTKCGNFIAGLDGRSSIGRLGLIVHMTAGFGDIGFRGRWTLEISVVHPVVIYPDVEICQIYFETPEGDTDIRYQGKYLGQTEAVESRISLDFNKE